MFCRSCCRHKQDRFASSLKENGCGIGIVPPLLLSARRVPSDSLVITDEPVLTVDFSLLFTKRLKPKCFFLSFSFFGFSSPLVAVLCQSSGDDLVMIVRTRARASRLVDRPLKVWAAIKGAQRQTRRIEEEKRRIREGRGGEVGW